MSGIEFEIPQDIIHGLEKLRINYDAKTVTDDMRQMGWGTEKRQFARKEMKRYQSSGEYRQYRDEYERKMDAIRW